MRHGPAVPARGPEEDDPVGRYLATVRSQVGDVPASYLPPRGKRYPDAPRRPLPWPGPGSPSSTGEGLDRLGELLLGYGPRRVETPTWAGLSALSGVPTNTPVAARLRPAWVTLRKTVPSGGAFYPNEIYLAWAGSADLPGGVYHYDHVHHCLERLRAGSPAAHLDRLLGTAARPRHALLLTQRPWKNSSKYRAFGYALGTVDAGVLLGQLLTSPQARAARLAHDPVFAAELLGLDSSVETVYAIVDLAATGPVPPRPDDDVVPPDGAPMPPSVGLEHDLLSLRDADPAALAVHRAAMADPWEPDAEAYGTEHPPTGRAPIALPAVAPLDLVRAAAHRASAGNLGPGLTDDQLAAVLAYAGGHRTGTPAHGALVRQPLYPSIWCLVDRVQGIAPGAYRYEARRHLLWPVGPADAGDPGAATVPYLVDRRMATAGATVFAAPPAHRPVTGLSPGAFRRLHLLTGVAVHLAGLAGQAVGAAGRPLGGTPTEAATARLGLSGGHVPLIQVLLGAPKPRPGWLSVNVTEGSSYA